MEQLRVIDVFARYIDVDILRGISIRVEDGEIVTIIGPNGSGKSTLLRTIVNLNHPGKTGPPGGGIFYQGNRIDGLSPEERVDAVDQCLISCLKTRGTHGI